MKFKLKEKKSCSFHTSKKKLKKVPNKKKTKDLFLCRRFSRFTRGFCASHHANTGCAQHHAFFYPTNEYVRTMKVGHAFVTDAIFRVRNKMSCVICSGANCANCHRRVL